MLRNREYLLFAAFCGAVSVMLCAAMLFISVPAFICAAAAAVLLNLGYYLFSRWRYNEIKKLSAYLEAVYCGAKTLDIRENTEGELSVLKNDIYKITVALSEQAERAASEKILLSQALADISHQLKTPLTGALITADLLDTESLPKEKSAEFTARLRMLLERLNWLVATLLSLSRLDAGAITFAKSRLKVKKLIDSALTPLFISAELNGVQINSSCPDSALWQGDEHWTVQALLNIIKNCIEHTPNGIVNINCEDTSVYCKITIADNGGGIPSADLAHVFERFYKGAGSKTDSAGIGLSLSKSVIEKQGGSIMAENENGGALFTIYLNK